MQEDQSKISKPIDTQAGDEDENAGDDNEDTPEKMEEMKLRAKFPQVAKGPPSAFLQKRLQQRKFFDSGDYNMAKAKGLKLPVVAQKPVPPTSIPSKQQDALLVAVDESGGSTSPTGMEIPTPGRIPARKTSIVQPTCSKLSPQPLLHHSPTNPPTSTFENAVTE